MPQFPKHDRAFTGGIVSSIPSPQCFAACNNARSFTARGTLTDIEYVIQSGLGGIIAIAQYHLLKIAGRYASALGFDQFAQLEVAHPCAQVLRFLDPADC
ncbi:hypothetical protein D3C87_1863110 [compost metagenome]